MLRLFLLAFALAFVAGMTTRPEEWIFRPEEDEK